MIDQHELREAAFDVLRGQPLASLSTHSVRALLERASGESIPLAQVALALEGIVSAGMAHRVRYSTHRGQVSRVRYRLAKPDQQTLF